jgi:solute:Na+ symporter, SSS family
MGMLDWIVIGLYFGILLAVTWWTILKRKNSSTDYFLASRHIGWLVVGAAIFASNIGSEHLVGLAGSGAKSGVAMAHYELHAWCLLVLGWVMVPFYLRSNVFTMPEFLERRYTPAARWVLSIVSLVSYVMTKFAVGMAAGGVVFEVLFPDRIFQNIPNFWVGAVGVVAVTAVYAVLGGLTAVMYTEAIQTVVFIIGSATISIIGLHKLGGWGELRRVCPPEYFNLWKPLHDPDFPWLGMLVGAPIVGLWYWCTDQYMVQRCLAATNQTEARRGTIFGAYLKLLPLFIFIVPGMIAYALAKTGHLDTTVLQDGKSNQAFPILVRDILPAGLRGLVVAGLLAALMSSLASALNSSATLFTMDIYKKLRPQSSDQHLVWIGRVATGFMVVVSLAWIPFMGMVSGSLYQYLQSVQSYMAPPIFAVFFLGVFAKRINGVGCLTGLIGGFVLGMLRLAAEICKNKGMLVKGTFLFSFADLNYLYFEIVLLVAALVLIVVGSLLTAPPAPEKLAGLTYSTTSDKDRNETRAGWNKWDVIHTCAVLCLILVIYWYFSGTGQNPADASVIGHP